MIMNRNKIDVISGARQLLQNEELVDVTLAVEGHLVKAHRLVLSVCSPFFQNIFTQMPANHDAFIFLKDVPYNILKDIIEFMYCGEVNVEPEILPIFIDTAKSLQIKGLTENGDSMPSQSDVTHTSIKTTTSMPTNVQHRPRSVPQCNISRTTSYKINVEDGGGSTAKTVLIQAQKRTLQRPGITTTAKRARTVSDPLQTSESSRAGQSIGQSRSQSFQLTSGDDKVGEPEFIDLPTATLPIKAEPEYGEEAELDDGVDGEATFVENESYGDLDYDGNYFTEGASASGYSGSYVENYAWAMGAQGFEKKRTPKGMVKYSNPKYDISNYMETVRTYIVQPGVSKVTGVIVQDHRFTAATQAKSSRNGQKYECVVSGCPCHVFVKQTEEKTKVAKIMESHNH